MMELDPICMGTQVGNYNKTGPYSIGINPLVYSILQ